MKLTLHQVLTLASVIEKETGVKDERELIAAVFHNRLRKKIPLQSDPTVIYGLTAYDGNIHKRDLFSVSPYNTYRVRGLPPGPIASPGVHSLRAALVSRQGILSVFCLPQRWDPLFFHHARRAQRSGGEVSEAAVS